ncbi:MAG: hypothetical protein IJU03_06290, partial [Thermoguttaceae bacterium]|nr:hypothetical protein [Thermoguttaceae bacterium]
MKTGYLHVCVVLDASLSMSSRRDYVVASLEAFLNERRAALVQRVGQDAQMKLDVYLFAEKVKRIVHYANLEIFDFSWLRAYYHCEGATAFNDAFVEAVDSLGADFAAMSYDKRPETALVVVVTDGRDNASRRFNVEDVKRRYELQTAVYSWQFEFFCAQLDDLRDGCPDDETHVDLSAPGQSYDVKIPSQDGGEQVYSEISDDELVHSEISDDELAHSEISDDEQVYSEISSDELAHSEISDDELAHSEISDDEQVYSEISSDELVHSEISSDELVHSEISDDEL